MLVTLAECLQLNCHKFNNLYTASVIQVFYKYYAFLHSLKHYIQFFSDFCHVLRSLIYNTKTCTQFFITLGFCPHGVDI